VEINETGIEHFETVEEIIEALNGHFKTVSAEKHPQAMINFIMRKAADKTLKNYNKKNKVSVSTENRLRNNIIQELRKFYGEWANIYGFSIKAATYRTNFDLIFKTEFGRLYGASPGTIHDHIFFTSHCFEQHKLRGDCFKQFPLLVLAYKRIMKTDPTSADLLRFITINSCEFCFERNFIYVNVLRGILVFEKLSQGVLIAKTYLLPDMDFPKKGWFHSRSSGFNLDLTDEGKEIANHFKKVPIEKPNFTLTECDYAEYVRVLKVPALNI